MSARVVPSGRVTAPESLRAGSVRSFEVKNAHIGFITQLELASSHEVMMHVLSLSTAAVAETHQAYGRNGVCFTIAH